MIEIGHELARVLMMLAFVGGGTLAYHVGHAIRQMIADRSRRLADHQEHRQALERERVQHEQRLATATKLNEVLAIAIADREMAGAIRDEIDRVHPNVRVSVDDEATQDGMRSSPRRRRRG